MNAAHTAPTLTSLPNTVGYDELLKLATAVADMLRDDFDLEVDAGAIVFDVGCVYFPQNPRLPALCRIVPRGTPRRANAILAIRTLLEEAWETATGVPYCKAANAIALLARRSELRAAIVNLILVPNAPNREARLAALRTEEREISARFTALEDSLHA